jgi:hypothetical protein
MQLENVLTKFQECYEALIHEEYGYLKKLLNEKKIL